MADICITSIVSYAYDFAAGIAGRIILNEGDTVIIEDCINIGKIEGNRTKNTSYVSGIANVFYGCSFDTTNYTASVNNCVNAGHIKGWNVSGITLFYYDYLLQKFNDDCNITNSINTGVLESYPGGKIGGIEVKR